MDVVEMHELAVRFLDAWNSQEVERVLDCYTDDLIYVDPNTHGPVRGREAMARYLAKLFAAWKMTWSLREAHLHADANACSVLWHATFRRATAGPTVEAEGMDLVVVREGRIARNEVRFDRSVLGQVGQESSDSLRQLLLRGWMTHDAMWLASALDEGGIGLANRLNRAAIRRMAPIEVKRMLGALGMTAVESYAQLEQFTRGAMALLDAEFMRYRWEWRPPDAMRLEFVECFAHKGVSRLGAIGEYQCGILERIWAWWDALGVVYEVRPCVEHCTMHHAGNCVRDVRFRFPPA